MGVHACDVEYPTSPLQLQNNNLSVIINVSDLSGFLHLCVGSKKPKANCTTEWPHRHSSKFRSAGNYV